MKLKRLACLMLPSWPLQFPKTGRFSPSTGATLFNIHTEFLHQNRTHSGIIVSDQLEIGVVIRRLLKLLDARSTEDMRNWLEFLSNWR